MKTQAMDYIKGGCMTKTLTEQWRDGTLPEGLYYIEGKGNYDIALIRNRYCPVLTSPYSEDTVFESEFVPVEPVPSYDEYKRLQEQLKEARHTIYCIANTDGSDCKTILETIIRDANLYLEKWSAK